MRTLSMAAIAGLAAAVALNPAVSFAGDAFEGTWKVKDTAGKAFEIILSKDMSAKANRGSEGLTGTWKEEGNSAVITWNTGWTTKITKEDGHYKKVAYKKGDPLSGKPTNTSDAEKAK